ncbi:Hypothetical predicted protein [Cloeon dipterum]|uniref:Uncharacterized protein n=1 Tax=Cloeon dipterum TaxID=197152 RepID=A0A8S1EDP1_9INSE|nr:Hypothetical predicted protein [Cloeon dipterum]
MCATPYIACSGFCSYWGSLPSQHSTFCGAPSGSKKRIAFRDGIASTKRTKSIVEMRTMLRQTPRQVFSERLLRWHKIPLPFVGFFTFLLLQQ